MGLFFYFWNLCLFEDFLDFTFCSYVVYDFFISNGLLLNLKDFFFFLTLAMAFKNWNE